MVLVLPVTVLLVSWGFSFSAPEPAHKETPSTTGEHWGLTETLKRAQQCCVVNPPDLVYLQNESTEEDLCRLEIIHYGVAI